MSGKNSSSEEIKMAINIFSSKRMNKWNKIKQVFIEIKKNCGNKTYKFSMYVEHNVSKIGRLA